MNTVQLKGFLANDLRYNDRGERPRAEFLLKVMRPVKGEDGRRKRDLIPIVTWGNQASNAVRFLEKGRAVLIQGRIASEFWPPDRAPGSRLITKVIAERIEYLDRPSSGTAPAEVVAAVAAPPEAPRARGR